MIFYPDSVNSCGSSERINLSPFTKDFRDGPHQMSIFAFVEPDSSRVIIKFKM